MSQTVEEVIKDALKTYKEAEEKLQQAIVILNAAAKYPWLDKKWPSSALAKRLQHILDLSEALKKEVK